MSAMGSTKNFPLPRNGFLLFNLYARIESSSSSFFFQSTKKTYVPKTQGEMAETNFKCKYSKEMHSG